MGIGQTYDCDRYHSDRFLRRLEQYRCPGYRSQWKKQGNFKAQMANMLKYVAIYSLVYFLFINRVYGILQMMVVLSIPLLKRYNGERGKWKGMKWLFYIYYPLHLVICGIVRIALHGNIGVMIGGA